MEKNEKPPKPPLRVVSAPDATGASPRRKRSKPSDDLRRSLIDDCKDAASRALLDQACDALDAAHAYAAAVKRDGSMIAAANGGLRAHPLARLEIQMRSLATRLIAKLKATADRRHALGRPAHGFGWIPPDPEEDDE